MSDGIFPDYLHKDIFKIFGGWLPLDDGKESSFKHDQWYQDKFLNEPESDFRENELNEIYEDFNKIYNFRTIKNAIIEYKGMKDRRDILNRLAELADKHDIPINVSSRLDENDLEAFLQRSDIDYGKLPLSEKERVEI